MQPNFKEVTLSILAIGFCFFFPHLGLLPITAYPAVVLLVLWLYIRFIVKGTFGDLLFSVKRFETRAVWIGILAAIFLSLFFQYAWDPLINRLLPGRGIDLSDFSFVRHNTPGYIFVLLLALFVGGFYEELVFHGFIFTRLENILGGKQATIPAFIITNLIFGAYHFQMGLRGVLLATIAGSVYHLLILRNGRNLWYGVFVHACYDFIGLTYIYLGYL